MDKQDELDSLAVAANKYLIIRRYRQSLFPELSFPQSIWDLLIQIFVRQVLHKPISPLSLSSDMLTSPNKITQWISELEQQGILKCNHTEGALIELSEKGFLAMETWFRSKRTMDRSLL